MNIKNCFRDVADLYSGGEERREDIFEVMIPGNSPNLMTNPANSGNTNQ